MIAKLEKDGAFFKLKLISESNEDRGILQDFCQLDSTSKDMQMENINFNDYNSVSAEFSII